jgi:uncharacterized protein YdeI (YjbR/CyaY-like superfamily)
LTQRTLRSAENKKNSDALHFELESSFPFMKPTFFKTPSDFRKWLEKHHDSAGELLVGFYKKDSGKPSITWPESVDQALCFGWIDGIRKSLGGTSYTIRFTPRKQRSIWSAVNIKRAMELIDEGLMRPAGLKAFEARQENRSGIYSYEQRPKELPEPYAKRLKKNKAAEEYFESRPASYRRAAIWWVISAKKEETRLSRLEKLIEYSSKNQAVPQFLRPQPKD